MYNRAINHHLRIRTRLVFFFFPKLAGLYSEYNYLNYIKEYIHQNEYDIIKQERRKKRGLTFCQLNSFHFK